MAVGDGKVLQRRLSWNLRQARQAPCQRPQNAICIAGGGRIPLLLDQLHRLADGGPRRDAAQKHQLISSQPQGVQQLRRELFRRAAAEAADEKIQIGPVLQNAVGQRRSQRRILLRKSGAGLFQKKVRPGSLPAEGDQRPQGRFSGGHLRRRSLPPPKISSSRKSCPMETASAAT